MLPRLVQLLLASVALVTALPNPSGHATSADQPAATATTSSVAVAAPSSSAQAVLWRDYDWIELRSKPSLVLAASTLPQNQTHTEFYRTTRKKCFAVFYCTNFAKKISEEANELHGTFNLVKYNNGTWRCTVERGAHTAVSISSVLVHNADETIVESSVYSVTLAQPKIIQQALSPAAGSRPTQNRQPVVVQDSRPMVNNEVTRSAAASPPPAYGLSDYQALPDEHEVEKSSCCSNLKRPDCCRCDSDCCRYEEGCCGCGDEDCCKVDGECLCNAAKEVFHIAHCVTKGACVVM